MRRALTLPLAAVAGVLAALLPAYSASAHALLVRSIPESNADLTASPPTIDLWFSEPLEATFSSVRVIDSTGEEVPTGAEVLDPTDATHLTLPLGELGPGIYTVAWQTLSQVDGHEWFGSFPFTVLNLDGSRPESIAATIEGGRRGELPSPGEVGARWLALVGGMLLFGGLVFATYVVPANRFPGLAPTAQRLLKYLIWGAAAAILLGGASQLVLQSVRLGGLNALARLTLETRSGALVLLRVLFVATALNAGLTVGPIGGGKARSVLADIASFAAVVALLVLLAASTERPIAIIGLIVAVGCLAWIGGPWNRNPVARLVARTRALTLLGIAILLTFSVSSHAGAAEGSFFAVAGDALHLLAAAAWIGGLMLIPILWRSARTSPGKDEFLPAVRRFSTLAASSVYIVLLTGVFSALVELPTLRSLWETAYGLVLLAKLSLVCLALGVAYFNNRSVREQSFTSALPRRIAVEAGIAAVVLLAVAFLVQTPTPRSLTTPSGSAAIGQPYNAIGSAGDLNLHLQVDPNLPGRNRFWTHLFTNDGSSIGEVQLVRLRIEDETQQLGRSDLDLVPLGQGTFAAEGANLSQAGNWSIQIYVRRRGLDDLLIPFAFAVPPGATAVRASGHFGHPVPGIPPLVLIGGLLFCAGAVPFLWGNDFKVLARESHRSWLLIGGTVALVGLLALGFGFATRVQAEVPPLQRTNPVPATAESVARGGEIYSESCAICHGATGRGDGPVGVTLNPRPPDLFVHMQPGVHTDGQLFDWITNGFPNSAMTGFADRYSEEDRWNVINFIRTFAARTPP